MQITLGQGVVQGMMEGRNALQQQVLDLQAHVTNLADEIGLLRLITGQPPKHSDSCDTTPASTEQLPAREQLRPGVSFPRQCIGHSSQPAPSPSSCFEV